MRPRPPARPDPSPTLQGLSRYSVPGAVLTLFLLILMTGLAGPVGCSKSPTGSELALNNCTACHTSQAQLVATAEVDEGGEGGTPGEG